jgi:tRNA(fMet)-specific endonuclease VapC
MYLLDTNACIRILNDSSPALVQRLASHAPSEIRLCSIVKAELIYGARHSQQIEENLKLLACFFAPFVSLPFNDRCAEQYGQIRAGLALAGALIGPNDPLIAAIARAYDLTLVTHNVEEFGRVTDLRLEDWEIE